MIRDIMVINYLKYIMFTSSHYISNGGTQGGKVGDQIGYETEIRNIH